jgi:hypothetical protein
VCFKTVVSGILNGCAFDEDFGDFWGGGGLGFFETFFFAAFVAVPHAD